MNRYVTNINHMIKLEFSTRNINKVLYEIQYVWVLRTH